MWVEVQSATCQRRIERLPDGVHQVRYQCGIKRDVTENPRYGYADFVFTP